MIYIENHILDPNTMMPVTSYEKIFVSCDDFIKFYRLAKIDKHSVLNVMFYNPHENAGQKNVNDAKLYSMSREIQT